MDPLYALLLDLIDEDTYETEYDGRMYTFCKHCDKSYENDKPHDATCITMRARTLISSHFPQEEQKRLLTIELERKRREEKNRRNAIDNYTPKHKWVNCIHCHQQVGKHNLRSHIGSKSCLKEQRNIAAQIR